jgi:hypothetical protein
MVCEKEFLATYFQVIGIFAVVQAKKKKKKKIG